MVNYQFEEVQHFKVAIHDYNTTFNMDDLENHELYGEAEFKLADVITAGKVLTIPLVKHEGSKYVIIPHTQ